ncbi:MAG: nucleotidyltransferase family protein [Prevotella sp.]|nr:nucleotidyltransferase family protein [Prevotella sp.]
MKCVILAAGYATRLYPLTENFPKPLLEVAGKPILDWLIDDMAQTGLIDEYIVISNHKFASIFEEWATKNAQCTMDNAQFTMDNAQCTMHNAQFTMHNSQCKITVIDDGTSTNETRLGAVKDILLAIEGGSQIVNGQLSNRKSLDDDLLVMAGDNLLDFSLGGFIRYAKEKNATCVMRYYEADEARLHKTGVAEIDADGRILSMEEKPANPKSHWCIPAFYYYTREDTHLIKKGIESGCGTDAPGSFIAWLCGQTCVYAWEMPGRRYDIGNLASYEKVKKTFKI